MMKETKDESPLMKKLSDILADKNDDYYAKDQKESRRDK